MRRLALALLLLSAAPAAAQTRAVTFEVVVPGVLAPLDTVFLAGTFNGWNPGDGVGDGPSMDAALPMAPAGPNRFRLTVDVPDGPTEYKYTLGAWRSVEMTAADGERANRMLGDRAVVRDTVAQWLVPSVALGAWRADDLFPEQSASFVAWHERAGLALADTLSADELDALLADAEAAWAADAARLGLPPLPLLPGLLASAAFGPGESRMEHVVRTYVLPRQRALLGAFEREPVHPSRLSALNAMIYHAVTLPLRFDVDAAEAADARALSTRVLALAERYCAVDFGVRGGELACRLRDDAAESAGLWALVAASTGGEARAATDGFVRLVQDGLETQDDPGLVRDLSLRHALRAPREDGLRVLDVLLTGTSDRFTSADSLRALYVRLDPAGGAARYERLLAQRPVFRLPVVPDAPPLEGHMPDVVARGAFSLDALAGRLVLLDVWATWCGPCLAEIPTFNALHDALAGRDDVAFVSLLADARTGGLLPMDAEAFVTDRGVRYPVLYDLAGDDEALGAALGVFAYPSAFLVYPDGGVRAVPMDLGWRRALALATDELGLAPVDVAHGVEP